MGSKKRAKNLKSTKSTKSRKSSKSTKNGGGGRAQRPAVEVTARLRLHLGLRLHFRRPPRLRVWCGVAVLVLCVRLLPVLAALTPHRY